MKKILIWRLSGRKSAPGRQSWRGETEGTVLEDKTNEAARRRGYKDAVTGGWRRGEKESGEGFHEGNKKDKQ